MREEGREVIVDPLLTGSTTLAVAGSCPRAYNSHSGKPSTIFARLAN